MDEKQKIVELNPEETGEERDKEARPKRREELVVKGKTPFTFEGKTYHELDLSGLEALTIQAAVDAQRELMGQQEEAAMLLAETTTAFSLFSLALAAKATGKPIELFKLLPMGWAKRVVNTVRGYMNGEAAEGHRMKLDTPYEYEGETYSEIDLSGVADLNAMHLSEAENRMTKAGFLVTENSFNFLYACIIGGMAVKKPEAFFLGMPLRELLKLKAAVNDEDFFA